jgi:hypothetical protein
MKEHRSTELPMDLSMTFRYYMEYYDLPAIFDRLALPHYSAGAIIV